MTEFIDGGDSLNRLVKLMVAIGYDFDIASVFVSSEFLAKAVDHPDYAELTRRLKYGAEGKPVFTDWKILSGVRKDLASDSPHPVEHGLFPERVRQAREDIEVIAREISRHVH